MVTCSIINISPNKNRGLISVVSMEATNSNYHAWEDMKFNYGGVNKMSGATMCPMLKWLFKCFCSPFRLTWST